MSLCQFIAAIVLSHQVDDYLTDLTKTFKCKCKAFKCKCKAFKCKCKTFKFKWYLAERFALSIEMSRCAGCAELADALAPWNRGSVELFCVSAYSAYSAYLLQKSIVCSVYSMYSIYSDMRRRARCEALMAVPRSSAPVFGRYAGVQGVQSWHSCVGAPSDVGLRLVFPLGCWSV